MDADFIGLIGRLCAVVVAATAGSVRAEVITDGSIGPRVRLGGDFEIGAELGQRAGRNLFHSFERFSLEAGERATFSGPAEIRNLISRVTGAARSEIDGTLRSTIPGADFFFLNPAGVVFGPNARLDLKGSFHVSTADELRFADGATFSATNPAVSSFTVAAPAAFGFLRPSPAPIMVDSASLAVPEGQSLSLVGGDVDIRSTSAFADNLIAPGGRIDLVSAASAGEVVLETEGVDAAGVARFGSIRLSDSADVDATGPGGGSVQIRGGEFVIISNSTVFADNTGPLDATGGIAFDAETVTIGSGSRVTTDVFGGGNGGAIAIQAERVDLNGGAVIGSTTFGAGAGGPITIAAREALVMSGPGSALRAESGRFSSGAGGEVAITAPRVELRDGAIISASPIGSGNGGDIVLDAGRLTVTGGVVQTATLGTGRAGDLTIAAGESIEMLGEGSAVLSGARDFGPAGNIRLLTPRLVNEGGIIESGTTSQGAAGDIDIVVENLVLSDADVFTGALSSDPRVLRGAPAGDLTITAEDSVSISSGSFVSALSVGSEPAGTVTIQAPILDISGSGTFVDASILTPSSFDPSAGGDIVIDVSRLALTNGAEVVTRTVVGESKAGNVSVTASNSVLVSGGFSTIDAGSFGSGSGGRIAVKTPRLEIRNNGSIGAPSRASFPPPDDSMVGAAGDVTIEADLLVLAAGGSIDVATTGAADAGQVDVKAGQIVIEGAGSGIVTSTGIAEGAEEVPDRLGDAGSITVTADRLTLRNGGEINTSATRESTVEGLAGNAGNITIIVADRLEMDRGAVTTEAQQSAGGGITLTVGALVLLADGSRITSTIFGDRQGDRAGNITIDPRFLILDESDIIARANAGDGGRISIVADNLVRSAGSEIDASSRTGISGTVATSSPEADLSGGLLILDAALLDAASQLRERCASRRDIGASSFTGVGRGGLPASPDGPLGSAYPSAYGDPRLAVAAPQEGGKAEQPAEGATWPAVAGLAPCHGAF